MRNRKLSIMKIMSHLKKVSPIFMHGNLFLLIHRTLISVYQKVFAVKNDVMVNRKHVLFIHKTKIVSQNYVIFTDFQFSKSLNLEDIILI